MCLCIYVMYVYKHTVNVKFSQVINVAEVALARTDEIFALKNFHVHPTRKYLYQHTILYYQYTWRASVGNIRLRFVAAT